MFKFNDSIFTDLILPATKARVLVQFEENVYGRMKLHATCLLTEN